jgi:hypothetical protein
LDREAQLFVVVVSAKFEELSRFCPYINVEDAMVSKCLKFESGLRPDIYQYMCIQGIRDFDTLVHKCHMFDDAGRAKANHYKAQHDKKRKSHGFGKPYSKDKGKKKEGGGASNSNVAELRSSSVAHWVILLKIARRVIVATSVGKRVTRLLSVLMWRRRLLATIVVRRVISVLSVPSRRRQRERCLH